jgi:hypothetical protein
MSGVLDSNRPGDYVMSGSLAVKVSNGIALLIIIVLFTGPMWDFIPWSLTPRGSSLGNMRVVIETFLCHLGLIFWPLAIVLFVHLFRRTHWLEWLKLAALTALCFWIAWHAAQGVIWSWTWLCHKLAHLYNG